MIKKGIHIIYMMFFVFQWIYGQDPPEEFLVQQSILQGFYFFNEVTLNGHPIESNDWVAAFKGDVCVGARQWDTSSCGGGVCDIPVLGDDGTDYTTGYMQNGDLPTFKIYDTSLGNIFDAIPSEEVDGWLNFGFSMNDLLEANWSINPADFQYNGSITSKVFINENEVGTIDDMLGAFVGDEIRGVVNGLAIPPELGGGYSFNIMIFSNDAGGEMVEFKFYQASSNTVVFLNETIEFMSDMTIGNALSPFVLTGNIEGEDIVGCTAGSACNYNASATVDDASCSFAEENYDCDGNCIASLDCFGECGGSAVLDDCGVCGGDDFSCLSIIDSHLAKSFRIDSIYPNPFNPVINIDLSIDIVGHLQLTVFTIDGIQIKTIYNGPSVVGESTFTWRSENIASGFYFISAVIGDQTKTQKVSFLK